jgi:hypothetical protein
MLPLDGLYNGGHDSQVKPGFQRVKAPDWP